MIVSVHIPKTAGTSFRSRLAAGIGERLLLDYDDWVETQTTAAEQRRSARRMEMLGELHELSRRYDVIHGHFAADKYADLFQKLDLITFVRDPYQQALSAYDTARRAFDAPNPAIRLLHEKDMTCIDMIEAFPNHQSLYFSGKAVDEFAMIGIYERFDESVALFQSMFGIKLPDEEIRINVNPNRQGLAYDVDPDVRKAVDTHRAADIALYRRAQEHFASRRARFGI